MHSVEEIVVHTAFRSVGGVSEWLSLTPEQRRSWERMHVGAAFLSPFKMGPVL